jgi:protein-L-isoaspartate(D-aspartate) O-methyltransferase
MPAGDLEKSRGECNAEIARVSLRFHALQTIPMVRAVQPQMSAGLACVSDHALVIGQTLLHRMASWRSGYAEDCKSLYGGSIPSEASNATRYGKLREPVMPDMSQARRVMVDNQIRTFDVTDRDLLSSFDVAPRENFVAPADRALAYSDSRLAVVGQGTTRALLVPMVLARLMQALQPQEGETALDCFGGLGYGAALFSHLGLVTTLAETDAGLVEGAKAALADLANPVRVLPPSEISTDRAPGLSGELFDVILVNGAVERAPQSLLALLKDGGRLGVIMRKGRAAQAHIYLRSGANVSARHAFDAQAVLLPGFAEEPGFVF